MNYRFDDTLKEQVRSRADIAVVVGRYVNLKQSGQTLKGLCPFHKEKTPSFHVNPSRGFFHCFGCGKSGDVFKFLEEIEGIDFKDALSRLAEENGIELRKQNFPAQDLHQASPGEKLNKQELFTIHEIASKYYYLQVKNSPKAISYYKSRGLTGATAKTFRLGFAPESWTGLIDYCAKQGYSSSKLVVAGLAIEKEGGKLYDRFRNRVIFPLFDLSGRVIAFAGRGMDKDATPKYLNSPETPLYQKKSFLYGLYHARTAIKEEGFVIVVEGYMDYLSLYQAGIQNVVASSGTAFTTEHAHCIKRFTNRVVLVFDGDNAGQTAAQRAIFVLAPFNLDVSILVLPGDEDPDSFVQANGPEPFKKLLKNAKNFIDFIIQKAIIDIGGASGVAAKASIIDTLSPLVRALGDPIIQARFKKELAEQLGVDERLVYQKIGGSVRQEEPQIVKPSSNDELFINSLECSFLRLLISNPELIDQARQYVTPETITETLASDIYSVILATYDETGSLQSVLDRIKNSEHKRLLAIMLVKPYLQEHIQEELVQKVIQLRRKFLKYRIREAKLLMKKESENKTELLQEIMDLTRQLKELDD